MYWAQFYGQIWPFLNTVWLSELDFGWRLFNEIANLQITSFLSSGIWKSQGLLIIKPYADGFRWCRAKNHNAKIKKIQQVWPINVRLLIIFKKIDLMHRNNIEKSSYLDDTASGPVRPQTLSICPRIARIPRSRRSISSKSTRRLNIIITDNRLSQP